MKDKIEKYFSGKKLYGDDFDKQQIIEWFKDEEEGYSGLITKDHVYEFHALNGVHGYSKLKNIKKFKRVLGFGSAMGEELLPIIDKIDEISIVEPSEKLKKSTIGGKKVTYQKPSISGKLKFPDNHFDLITCFGVLHHIANVSFIMKEFSRVLKKGGILLIREPIVSMGDWRKKRKGLTKRERGIPLNLFRKIIINNELEVISERKVFFPLIRRVRFGKWEGGNSKFFIWMDFLLSLLFSWNDRYHSTNVLHKIRPQAIYYVLKK